MTTLREDLIERLVKNDYARLLAAAAHEGAMKDLAARWEPRLAALESEIAFLNLVLGECD